MEEGYPPLRALLEVKSCAGVSSEKIIRDDVTLALVNARSSKRLSAFLSISTNNKYQDIQW